MIIDAARVDTLGPSIQPPKTRIETMKKIWKKSTWRSDKNNKTHTLKGAAENKDFVAHYFFDRLLWNKIVNDKNLGQKGGEKRGRFEK